MTLAAIGASVSSLRNGGVSGVFDVGHGESTEALRLHAQQGRQVRLEVYEEMDD